MTERIGFIGTGNMGGGIVRRMLSAGFDIIAYDVNPSLLAPLRRLGVTVAASQREVADLVEVIFASLPSEEVSREVALGANGIAAGRRIRYYVETSTIGPEAIVDIADGLSERGIGLLDCPVSGGPKGAEAGTLAFMASGPDEVYQRVAPILAATARHVFHLGGMAGMAQTCKLVNNVISYTGAGIAYEAIVFGVKAGLDAKTMIDVINVSTGRNTATLEKFPKAILPRTFDYGGPLFVNIKDLNIYMQQAEKLGVPVFIASTVAQLWRLAGTQDTGRLDSTTVIKTFEKWAGVEVKG